MTNASDTVSPELAAEIAARKRKLDRQTVMAVAGLTAVALFMVFDPQDHTRTASGMLKMLPWLIGLSIAIYLLNRWTFSIQTRLLKHRDSETGGA